MFALFKKNESSGIFIPFKNGFKEVTTINIKDHSFNDVSSHLGYSPNKIHVYFGDFDTNFEIQNVFFDIETKKIVWIHVKSDVKQIDSNKLEHFLRNLDSAVEFSTYM